MADNGNAAAGKSAEDVEVTVTFTNQQLAELRRVADLQGISIGAALRQALALSSFVVNAKFRSDTHILVKRGRDIQELELAS